ncbi:head decoration protein [Megamonas hypermegale]|uniref:head decoration protein n=1 Tax=Megamonas hypermegale TaxID=158847 RepID=UPI0025A3A76F|nr:head decoration protein [Megamonas hypermegale]MDM8143163.1 hypothetical protein [Megamonas hypermegale]
MAMSEKIIDMVWDELIGSSAVPLITANVNFAQAAAEQTLKRGTLLAINEAGDYIEENFQSETAGEKVGVAILAKDVQLSTTGKVVGTVYINGMFNRNKIILKDESDDINNHEAELRDVGILLTNLHGFAAESED